MLTHKNWGHYRLELVYTNSTTMGRLEYMNQLYKTAIKLMLNDVSD